MKYYAMRYSDDKASTVTELVLSMRDIESGLRMAMSQGEAVDGHATGYLVCRFIFDESIQAEIDSRVLPVFPGATLQDYTDDDSMIYQDFTGVTE